MNCLYIHSSNIPDKQNLQFQTQNATHIKYNNENVSYSNIKKEDIQEAVKEVLNKVQEKVSKEAITKLPVQTAETLFESRESKTKVTLKKVKKIP